MIGTVLDKYEILQKVGEGGMATVYRGRHLTLGRDVAVKVLHPHLSASSRNRARFAREARAIEHLDHDNILKIYDYSGTDTEDCFIVTELVDGVTLHRLIVDRGRLPGEVACMVGRKLAQALEYAHTAGIIHRDLKPENVMVRRDGAVKLMDFGIARFLDEVNLTMTGALVGSPAYMSPEQAMEHVLDPRSDLFSLGTLLFHVVTGHLPFSGGNPSIILRNIIEGTRPEVMEQAPDISSSLADLIERLLQTDPAARPANAGEVREALDRALAEVEIDPEDPRWTLHAWLVEPDAYETRLKQHLSEVLLAQGKARLAQGDHLGALRLLNRLLSMDEDNAEVMALVSGMHNTPPARAPSSRRRVVAVAVAAGAVVLAAVAVLAWSSRKAQPEPAAHIAAPAPDPSPPRTVTPPRSEPRPNAPAAPPTPKESPPPTRTRSSTSTSGTAPESSPTTSRSAPPAEAPPEASAAPVDPPAKITVLVPLSWADIYVDQELKGRTGKIRWPLAVSPGTHALRVENDLALPYNTTFTVTPGEVRTIEVTALQRKPVTVRFDAALDRACRVSVDNVDRGTLAGLNWALKISDPDARHAVALVCPDGRARNYDLPEAIPGSVVPLGAP